MPDRPEPTPDDPAADGPPPAPPPDHVSDPIPPPVDADGKEVATATDSVPDLLNSGTDAETEEVVASTDSVPDLADLGTDAESDPVPEDPDSTAVFEGYPLPARGGTDQVDLGRVFEGEEAEAPESGAGTGTDSDDIDLLYFGTDPPGRDAELGTGTQSEREDDSGFIGEPPITDVAERLRKKYRRVGGVVALGVISFFLFANRNNDTVVVTPSDQQVETETDQQVETETEGQLPGETATDEETGSDPEPVSSSTDDPQGDGKNKNSEPVTPEENVPGADIKSVSYEVGPAGELFFIIDVYGNGIGATADAPNFLVDIEITGPDGWGTRVEFRNGEPQPGRVWLGPLAPGREVLEGAETSVEWLDNDTMKVTIAGTGTDLGVGSFYVDINVFWPDRSFYDHAEGAGS